MSYMRIALVGSLGVGKSTINIKYFNGTFAHHFDPESEDSYRIQFLLGDPDVHPQQVLMEVLDTASFQPSPNRDLYIRQSHGFLLVYSITSRSSFEDTRMIYNEIQAIKKDPSVPIILVGNKTDLEEMRAVTTQEAEHLSTSLNISFMEVSAKTDYGQITQLYHNIAQAVIDKGLWAPPKPTNSQCLLL